MFRTIHETRGNLDEEMERHRSFLFLLDIKKTGTRGGGHAVLYVQIKQKKDGPARSDSAESGCYYNLSELALPTEKKKGLFT